MSKAIRMVILWLSILGMFGCVVVALVAIASGQLNPALTIGLVTLSAMCYLGLNRAAKTV